MSIVLLFLWFVSYAAIAGVLVAAIADLVPVAVEILFLATLGSMCYLVCESLACF